MTTVGGTYVADEDERTCPAREGENRCGTPRPCPAHMPYQYAALLDQGAPSRPPGRDAEAPTSAT